MHDEDEEEQGGSPGFGDHPRDHPVRVQILDLLAAGRELSAGEVCEQLPDDRSLSTVHYHLLVLHRAEAVRASSESAERRYMLA
jgi:DNA-binding transcriptional ArsR family regulator